MTESAVSAGLRRRLSEIERASARLQGVFDADTTHLNETKKLVAEAKARQSLNDEVVQIIESLQQRSLGRSVGVFQNLLSSILQDVLPEEGKVRLLPEYKNNQTSLSIVLEKKPGRFEDILEGNGGAVTNVLSAGLRFAALARTKNRAMLVLDEPDCWLKPTRVPAFLKVIADVSSQGFQTFFVTHHDVSMVEGQVNVVEFSLDEVTNQVKATLQPPIVRDWASPQEKGIRGIELVNFCRHTRTYVPCYPGATAFVGENNLGKSAGMSGALRAVAYGESSEGQINHDADYAQVTYHLEEGYRLVWTRYRDKSPAVVYALYQGDNPTPAKEGRQPSRNKAPDWVIELLGITRVDDLDIQLKSQKAPVFLLDEPGTRQAKLLAIGKESSYHDTFLKRYEELKSRDRETVKHGEATVMRLSFRLKAFDNFAELLDTIAELYFDVDSVLESVEKLVGLLNTINELPVLEAREQLEGLRASLLHKLPSAPTLTDTTYLERLISDFDRNLAWADVVLPVLPATPQLKDTSVLENLIADILHHTMVVEAGELPLLPAVPEIDSVDELLKTGALLASLEKEVALTSGVLNVPEMPAVPEIKDLLALESNAVMLSTLQREHLANEEALALAATALAQATKEYEDFIAEIGGICPLCKGSMTAIHAHTE